MRRSPWLIRVLVGTGILALIYYYSWWFIQASVTAPWLLLLLPAAALYGLIQMLGNWILYLLAEHRPTPPPSAGDLTVDVFVTVCGEPISLVEPTLRAACEMEGAHRTWLLDDGADPSLAALAGRLGAGYLAREDHADAKAGNLNGALARTEGDIVVIFDVDHVPIGEFLTRSLGYFNDPQVGFVQVMLTFANHGQSWVASAAAETALDFYNPTSLGMDGMGGATLMGSNALIRRTALESINGYQPGLAEDLATSLQLQAAGWRSVYVPRPLAPGLAPPDLAAWFLQQFKWARGVFELLLTAFPRVFHKLTWGQRLSYSVRMTKYWIGPVVSFHLLATILILIFGRFELRAVFHDYLRHIMPLVVADAAIRYAALKVWRPPAAHSVSFLRAVILVYSTWPTYTLAWLMALTRIPLRFRATPKAVGNKLPLIWLMPQLAALLLLTLGLWYTVVQGHHQPSLLLTFAVVQLLLQLRMVTDWVAGKSRMMRTIVRRLSVAFIRSHS